MFRLLLAASALPALAFAAPPAAPKTKAGPAPVAKAGPPAIGKLYVFSLAQQKDQLRADADKLVARLDEKLAAPKDLTEKPGPMLDRISRTWQVRFIIDWNALRDGGVDDEDEYTVNFLGEESLRVVLDEALREIGKRIGEEERKPAWVFNKGQKAILISTRRALGGLPKVVEARDDREVPPFGERFARENFAETLDLPAVPFRQAAEFLAASWGVTLEADWKAMAAAGLDPAKPVTMKMQDVTLRAALDAIVAAAFEKLEPARRPTFAVSEKKVVTLTVPAKSAPTKKK